MAHTRELSGSYSGSVKDLVKESRTSIDSERTADAEINPALSNGSHDHINGVDHLEDTDDPIERLKRELERTKDEKEKLATQYRNLLNKLTQMRTSLGNKLQQDAVCNTTREIVKL